MEGGSDPRKHLCNSPFTVHLHTMSPNIGPKEVGKNIYAIVKYTYNLIPSMFIPALGFRKDNYTFSYERKNVYQKFTSWFCE